MRYEKIYGYVKGDLKILNGVLGHCIYFWNKSLEIYGYIDRSQDFEQCPGTLHLLLKSEPLDQSGMVLCMGPL